MKSLHEIISEAKAGCGSDYVQVAGWLGHEIIELTRELDATKKQLEYQIQRADANWRALCECREDD